MAAETELNRNKKFMKDVGIYAIGNLGSKLITFFMVPLYTYFIADVSDFGYYDLCLSVVFFFVPFVTLQLGDGAFRFLLNAGNDECRQRAVLSVIYRILASMLSLSLVIVVAVSMFWQIKYVWLSLGLLFAMSLHDVISQVARGLGYSKLYVSSGILSSIGIGAFSVLFVVVFEAGVPGIFWANILSRVVAIIFIELKVGIIRKYLSGNDETAVIGRKRLLGKILKYSLPLVYTTMYWWLINCSDRFFIAHYVGLEQNGIYSVAVRFTAILQTFGFIFYQAWQDSAFRQYNSSDRNSFFSKVLNGYIFAMVVILLLYTFGLKMIYPWLVEGRYQGSIEYLYPLGISAFLYTMVYFTNIIYQCALDTHRTMVQMIVVSCMNIILNFILVRWLGVYGVIVTSIVTYLVLLLYRIFDMVRYVKLKLNISSAVPIIMVVVGMLPFYFDTSLIQDIAFLSAAMILIYLVLPKYYKNMLFSKFHIPDKNSTLG